MGTCGGPLGWSPPCSRRIHAHMTRAEAVAGGWRLGEWAGNARRRCGVRGRRALPGAAGSVCSARARELGLLRRVCDVLGFVEAAVMECVRPLQRAAPHAAGRCPWGGVLARRHALRPDAGWA